MTDQANCGACGKSCGGQACNAGVCGCAAGQTMCTGVCKDLTSDNANCGACGKACAAGQACSSSACTTGGSRPTGCPAAAGLLSDFEEGSAVLVPQEGRTGWWYVYADTNAGSQTPPTVNNAPIAVAPVAASEQATCNKYALHSTAANHANYSGFGATMNPTGSAANQKAAVDLGRGMYTGLSFSIRSESGTTPVWFEFLNKETQPGAGCTACGVDLGGTATNNAIDAFNTRGRLMNGTGASAMWQIPTTTPSKTITVPFGTLGPRYLPSGCTGTVMCEAPAFNAASVLGVQFSIYDQFTTAGGYNLWVDNVQLVTGDTGLPTLTQTAGAAHPFPRDAAVGTCAKPTGATGKFLIEAYQNWKATFVVADGSNQRVQRPENNNDSVSEGIAYGMLIAVYMNDQTLFNGLFGFWKSHAAAGPSNAPLMDWKAGSGNGSAVDADEDAAFALIQASKQWSGGTYAADGLAMIKAIFSNEVESGTLAIKPGNNFGGNALTNPSYFAPAYYRVFATLDTGDNWAGVITKTYSMLNAIKGSNGVVPGWCTNGCTAAGSNGQANDPYYQYDAHRTPWRIGLDACWNGASDAQNYAKLITGFFATQATNGMGRVVDIYQTNGTPLTGAKYNSMSIIGTAGAGAMYSAGSTATHKQFLDRAWRFLLDASYTPDPTFRGGATGAYTYYNATVGLLTALTLSGNFNSF
jgi:endo-1,4-beta-D-glucanase Y